MECWFDDRPFAAGLSHSGVAAKARRRDPCVVPRRGDGRERQRLARSGGRLWGGDGRPGRHAPWLVLGWGALGASLVAAARRQRRTEREPSKPHQRRGALHSGTPSPAEELPASRRALEAGGATGMRGLAVRAVGSSGPSAPGAALGSWSEGSSLGAGMFSGLDSHALRTTPALRTAPARTTPALRTIPASPLESR